MSAKAAPAKSAWVSKREAEKMLGISERQLERRANQGYLEKKLGERQASESRAPVFYLRADVEALKAGTPNVHAVSTEAAVDKPKLQPSAASSLAVIPKDAARVDRFGELTAMMKYCADAAAVPDPKPWLTLDEAAEYSGFTRAYLLKVADTAKGHLVRDMGRGSRGGRFRFNRAELAK